MSGIPISMRFAALPGMAAMTAKIPPNKPIVKMILKQLGLKRALADGRFTEEMFDWFLSLLRDTDTLKNESAAPKIITPLRGQSPDVILSSKIIGRVKTPTLFIWGEEDPMGGAEIAEPFAGSFPNATLELLPNAGHAPWIDEPLLTAQLSRAFLLA